MVEGLGFASSPKRNSSATQIASLEVLGFAAPHPTKEPQTLNT